MCGTLLPYYISVKENKCYRCHLYGDHTPNKTSHQKGKNVNDTHSTFLLTPLKNFLKCWNNFDTIRI